MTSKLKVSQVAPRFMRGTTYIGDQGSTTIFHPHSQVILHDYATEDWVLDQITGDVDLSEYLSKEEAEDVYSQISYSAFEPLNSHVDDLWFDTNYNALKMCTEVERDDDDIVTSQTWVTVAGSPGSDPDDYLLKDEAVTTYQSRIEKGAPGGYVPLNVQGKIPSDYFSTAGFEIVGVYGEGEPLPDPETTPDGSAYLCKTDGYVDQYLPGLTSHSGDTAIDIGDAFELIPSTGTINANQVIETPERVFVHPDQIDEWSGEGVYLPLEGGTEHKMTGTLYMGGHRVTGLSGERENGSDAVSYTAADTLYLRQDGNSEMDGDLDMDSHLIDNVSDIEMETGGVINWAAGEPGGQLNYAGQNKVTIGHNNTMLHTDLSLDGNEVKNVWTLTLNGAEDGSEGRRIDVESGYKGRLSYGGSEKFGWGSVENWSYNNLDMSDNRIVDLAEPINNQDAATKKYVDDLVTGNEHAIGRKFLCANSGKLSTVYDYGDLFLTTEGNVSYTTTLANARYICFAMYDSDMNYWRPAKMGGVALPSCNIYLVYQGNTMGAFTYEGGTGSVTSGSPNGSIILPVTGWQSTTDQSSISAGSHYNIKCEWF